MSELKNVWIRSSDWGDKVYDDQEEALDSAMEIMIDYCPHAILDWYHSLHLSEKEKIFYDIQDCNHHEIDVKKVF